MASILDFVSNLLGTRNISFESENREIDRLLASTRGRSIPPEQSAEQPIQQPPDPLTQATELSKPLQRTALNPQVNKVDMPSSVSAIEMAGEEFGVDSTLLKNIAFAESSLDPRKKSQTSSAEGLFQFIDTSWEQMMRELGLPANTPKTNIEANTRAAALAIKKGRLFWWNASKHNWGKFINLMSR